MKLRKAVIPVAGLGTRFLPATKTVPKELLPIVDIPSIQYVVQEAVDAGIEEIIFVTGRGKDGIEDHFDDAPELEQVLADRGQPEMVKMLRSIAEMTEVVSVRQKKPLGLGHAVLCARHLVGDEPFAVVLPDDLMVGKPGSLKQMVDAYHEIGGGVIVAADEKPREETQRYGVIAPGRVKGNITEVKGVVEKPAPAEAPSTLCIIGRYILPPAIFVELERRERGAGNEIQLTDAMARLLGRVPFHAVTTTCARYDCGDKVGFLQANIAVGLERPDIAPALKRMLSALKIGRA